MDSRRRCPDARFASDDTMTSCDLAWSHVEILFVRNMSAAACEQATRHAEATAGDVTAASCEIPFLAEVVLTAARSRQEVNCLWPADFPLGRRVTKHKTTRFRARRSKLSVSG